jgi:hypothetical protein
MFWMILLIFQLLVVTAIFTMVSGTFSMAMVSGTTTQQIEGLGQICQLVQGL